jgi:hypothetical protein
MQTGKSRRESVGFFEDIIGDLVLARLTGPYIERRRNRRNARAFAEGRAVVFEGVVTGTPGYCVGLTMLVVDNCKLYRSTDPGGNWPRIPLPVDRLRLIETHPSDSPGWKVISCLDGDQAVVFRVAAENALYLERTLGTVAPERA